MINLYLSFVKFCSYIIAPFINLFARCYVGWEFFKSGRLKLDDMEETIENFSPGGDFALPIFNGEIAAYMATAGELILPVLLFVGLFTRIGAAGLLVMAAVIEIYVFPGTVQHYYWMMILGLILAQGGHVLSLDYWLLKDKPRY